jgi:hypothetical protein
MTDIARTGPVSITTQNLAPASGVATAGSTLEMNVYNSDSIVVQVTGVYTGALSIQGTVDGVNWITVGGTTVTPLSTGTAVAAIPSAGVDIYTIPINPGLAKVRVTALAAVTGTAVVVADQSIRSL